MTYVIQYQAIVELCHRYRQQKLYLDQLLTLYARYHKIHLHFLWFLDIVMRTQPRFFQWQTGIHYHIMYIRVDWFNTMAVGGHTMQGAMASLPELCHPQHQRGWNLFYLETPVVSLSRTATYLHIYGAWNRGVSLGIHWKITCWN